MPEKSENQELVTHLIAATRNQLSNAMNANAELEALLSIERKRSADLEQQLAMLKKGESSKND